MLAYLWFNQLEQLKKTREQFKFPVLIRFFSNCLYGGLVCAS